PDRMQRAGQCDVVDVVAGRARERTLPAPAGHAAVDEARVDRETVIGPQPKPFGHAGPESFDQRIRSPNERLHQRDARGTLQIDRDSAPTSREKIELARSRQSEVNGLWALDAQNVRPQIRQEHRAERPRTDARQLDNLDPSE